MLHSLGATLAGTLAWMIGNVSQGAEVLCTASSLETYVGAPVQIQVMIKNVEAHQSPVFPELAGAEVRELRLEGQDYPRVTPPVAGTGQTVTYTYVVIPRQAGALTIPPIRIAADGEVFSTSTIEIAVQESEAGDLLFLKLVGGRRSVYVGEPIQATLEIWLKLYRGAGIRLDADNMWRYAIDEQASVWGAFAANVQGRPQGITSRIETGQDVSGVGQRYVVYSLKSQVWPDRPGAFDAGGVRVVANYPLVMRPKRPTSLGRPYEVVESRPITAGIEDSQIAVKEPPREGRPDTFRGAVGRYTMAVAATPTEVSVGDPITLTLTIRGTGRLDTLQAPLLPDQASLTVDFRVPDEELMGVVDGSIKRFSQTIRAKHDDVTGIPPIRFSYFDPQAERYVTLKSAPIPLRMKSSTRLPVSQVVTGSGPGAGPTELTPTEAGLLANHNDVHAMLVQQTVSLGWGTWGLALSGPALCLACWLARRRHDRLTGDTAWGRRRAARKTALVAIRRAVANQDSSAAAAQAILAVTRYVADRCNLPVGNITRQEVIQALRLRDIPEATIGKVNRLLAECESMQYGAANRTADGAAARALIGRARECVNELGKRRL